MDAWEKLEGEIKMSIWGLLLGAALATATAGADVTKGEFGAAKPDETPKKTERKSEPGNKAPTYPFYGTLDAVDAKEKSITLRGKKKNRVILFTSETRFSKDGASASLTDGVPGERVSGSVRKNAFGKEEAVTIRFGAKASK